MSSPTTASFRRRASRRQPPHGRGAEHYAGSQFCPFLKLATDFQRVHAKLNWRGALLDPAFASSLYFEPAAGAAPPARPREARAPRRSNYHTLKHHATCFRPHPPDPAAFRRLFENPTARAVGVHHFADYYSRFERK